MSKLKRAGELTLREPPREHRRRGDWRCNAVLVASATRAEGARTQESVIDQAEKYTASNVKTTAAETAA
jgi:hypothetical protein